MIMITIPCYKSDKSMMTAACYESGNDNDKSNNNDKSHNNEDKICLLLKKWGWVSHVLDYMLDYIIIGLVTTVLHLWRIIKIWVSVQRYQIHLLESMKNVIKEEWKKLTEEDFCAYIESMPKQCKLVIETWGVSIKY